MAVSTFTSAPPGSRRAPEDRQRLKQFHRAARHTGLIGFPDVLVTSETPQVFTEMCGFFTQIVLDEAAGLARTHALDVEFVAQHATSLVHPALHETGGHGVVRAAATRAECARRVAALRSAQTAHERTLESLAGWAGEEIAKAERIWRRAHPHSAHLHGVRIPTFVVPPEARDFGQQALAAALNVSIPNHTSGGIL